MVDGFVFFHVDDLLVAHYGRWFFIFFHVDDLLVAHYGRWFFLFFVLMICWRVTLVDGFILLRVDEAL